MKVQPKTEKEIAEMRLMPKGWYPFTIGEAEEKTSKKGNEMIVLNVRVYRDNGFVFIKDYLMDTEFGAHKLRHIAETCGVLDDYERGGLHASDLIDKEGYAKIGIEKDKAGQYPDKNKIEDYASKPPETKGGADAVSKSESKPPKPADPDLDAEGDDIPF